MEKEWRFISIPSFLFYHFRQRIKLNNHIQMKYLIKKSCNSSDSAASLSFRRGIEGEV